MILIVSGKMSLWTIYWRAVCRIITVSSYLVSLFILTGNQAKNRLVRTSPILGFVNLIISPLNSNIVRAVHLASISYMNQALVFQL